MSSGTTLPYHAQKTVSHSKAFCFLKMLEGPCPPPPPGVCHALFPEGKRQQEVSTANYKQNLCGRIKESVSLQPTVAYKPHSAADKCYLMNDRNRSLCALMMLVNPSGRHQEPGGGTRPKSLHVSSGPSKLCSKKQFLLHALESRSVQAANSHAEIN